MCALKSYYGSTAHVHSAACGRTSLIAKQKLSCMSVAYCMHRFSMHACM